MPSEESQVYKKIYDIPFIWNSWKGKISVTESKSVVPREQERGDVINCKKEQGHVSWVMEMFYNINVTIFSHMQMSAKSHQIITGGF